MIFASLFFFLVKIIADRVSRLVKFFEQLRICRFEFRDLPNLSAAFQFLQAAYKTLNTLTGHAFSQRLFSRTVLCSQSVELAEVLLGNYAGQSIRFVSTNVEN